ncbi:endonuclease component of RuvABC resolvasome [Wigglesworthia glossinidia endosymbiont of Glossina morsitans morsitans (Yale colony)]|uniref:Crossover junction endodeoxyribonuclease RuvC n=1 Tax=Wigglesworthia glossinidia endosymbiont of Glossina morsitans morsitans (Yale colony) TaxID=1142511 RepID=H6Q4C0_WIGGL|nr:crossover junction endodeoxyribonuclease RuvC [Wigglesworthia glossinidia]AFA40980.1 endonuclease component of RuvABC resolvasome [Wigglesworthia glossinidia endosymbiont of Glossina morsitans morsitans (Yale colony)]
MAVILGVDPGSKITGYGIIKYCHHKITYITSQKIILNKYIFNERLKNIYSYTKSIIFEFNPKYFVIEKVFFYKNASSALKLNQASCAAILAAINSNISVFEYTSSKIKKLISGNGRSKKLKIKNRVCKILNLSCKNIQIDESDALAAAITHCFYI